MSKDQINKKCPLCIHRQEATITDVQGKIIGYDPCQCPKLRDVSNVQDQTEFDCLSFEQVRGV